MSVTRPPSPSASAVKNTNKQSGSEAKVNVDRQVLAEEKLKAYVERIVSESKPFSPEQRASLALLLHAGVSA